MSKSSHIETELYFKYAEDTQYRNARCRIYQGAPDKTICKLFEHPRVIEFVVKSVQESEHENIIFLTTEKGNLQLRLPDKKWKDIFYNSLVTLLLPEKVDECRARPRTWHDKERTIDRSNGTRNARSTPEAVGGLLKDVISANQIGVLRQVTKDQISSGGHYCNVDFNQTLIDQAIAYTDASALKAMQDENYEQVEIVYPQPEPYDREIFQLPAIRRQHPLPVNTPPEVQGAEDTELQNDQDSYEDISIKSSQISKQKPLPPTPKPAMTVPKQVKETKEKEWQPRNVVPPQKHIVEPCLQDDTDHGYEEIPPHPESKATAGGQFSTSEDIRPPLKTSQTEMRPSHPGSLQSRDNHPGAHQLAAVIRQNRPTPGIESGHSVISGAQSLQSKGYRQGRNKHLEHTHMAPVCSQPQVKWSQPNFQSRANDQNETSGDSRTQRMVPLPPNNSRPARAPPADIRKIFNPPPPPPKPMNAVAPQNFTENMYTNGSGCRGIEPEAKCEIEHVPAETRYVKTGTFKDVWIPKELNKPGIVNFINKRDGVVVEKTALPEYLSVGDRVLQIGDINVDFKDKDFATACLFCVTSEHIHIRVQKMYQP